MFVFSTGRLAVPTQDMDLQARRVFFFASDGVVSNRGEDAKEGVRL